MGFKSHKIEQRVPQSLKLAPSRRSPARCAPGVRLQSARRRADRPPTNSTVAYVAPTPCCHWPRAPKWRDSPQKLDPSRAFERGAARIRFSTPVLKRTTQPELQSLFRHKGQAATRNSIPSYHQGLQRVADLRKRTFTAPCTRATALRWPLAARSTCRCRSFLGSV